MKLSKHNDPKIIHYIFCSDHFCGNFIVMTASQKNFGRFNDKMVSIEIQKVLENPISNLCWFYKSPI